MARKNMEYHGKISEKMLRQFEWSKAAADWKSWIEILVEDGWDLITSSHIFDHEKTEHRTFVFQKSTSPPPPPPTTTV